MIIHKGLQSWTGEGELSRSHVSSSTLNLAKPMLAHNHPSTSKKIVKPIKFHQILVKRVPADLVLCGERASKL